MNKKKCTKCGEEKDFSAFSPASGYKNGLNSSCKICRNLTHRIWCEKNRDKLKFYQDTYSEKRKIWAEKNHEKYKEKSRVYAIEYRKLNPDKISETGRKYYDNNKNRIKLKQKTYYENNTEKALSISKIYYKNNEDKIKTEAKARCENLTDSIVRNRLGLIKEDCPQIFIEAKRAQLKLFRATSQ